MIRNGIAKVILPAERLQIEPDFEQGTIREREAAVKRMPATLYEPEGAKAE